MAESVVASSASSCFSRSRSRSSCSSSSSSSSRAHTPSHSRSLTLRISPPFSSPINHLHHHHRKPPSLFPRHPPLFLLVQSPATPTAASALDSDVPRPQGSSPPAERSPLFRQWDSLTAKFSASSNIPFLLLQLPQIILNARNLLSGNHSALLAVPWLGMLTGLLGNLSLLSYFIKKREKEAVVVQTLGVVSIYIVVSQLAMGRAMPLPIFLVTSLVVAAGLLLNFSNYFYLLPPSLWSVWEDFITIGGLSVLPQVMWSTFVPYIPHSILPGLIACFIAFMAVLMARTGKLSEKGVRFVGAISGWTATLLFMWMPVSQMWTNFLNPDNIKGLSASSMLLAMIGNGLMIPRALFIRDFMWFTGSTWAALFYGYGNIACLYSFKCISREFFLGATAGLLSWIGMALWRDMVAYGYNTPSRSIKELVFGP